MENNISKELYKSPRLKFADEKALKVYMEKYPEIQKLEDEQASINSATLAIYVVDVATMYLDVKYYNG
jgi:hypothetical protein